MIPSISDAGKSITPILFLLIALLFSGCASPGVIVDDEQFTPANIEAEELFAQMPNNDPQLNAVDGKARAQISRPGESERATVYFTSNRDTSILRVRNQLGIEGGRVLTKGDSVTLYNRIDEYAHRFSKDEAAYHYLSGITAMNLLDIMNPQISSYETEQVHVSANNYLIVMKNGTRFHLDRDELFITRIEYPAETPESFSIFIFQDHVQIEGYMLPRRIQILSSDQESNIFLLIRSLEPNPSNLDFNLDIPDEMRIERI
ncbi:MAG: DUF4292 domain-containing protein [Balneolales bacterium]